MELPGRWFETQIVDGGILDAAAALARLAETYYRAGRPEAAAADRLHGDAGRRARPKRKRG